MPRPSIRAGAAAAAAALIAICSGCNARSLGGVNGAPASDGAGFVDVTAAAGLRFRYDNDMSPARRFIETTGGGCAFVDYDNDGLLDIVAVQGGPAPGGEKRARPHNALYRNLGNGKFQDVTESAGLAVDTGYAQGVAAADYDNDGWTDLLITSYGGVHLFHNEHGHFVEVTKKAGLVERGEPHWCTSAAWGDYDRDGRLDLFVCHYASWFADNERTCHDASQERVYCQPTSYAGDSCVLYHNNGDGTFTDVSAKAGISALDGRAMSAVWLDYDDDGWPDLFISNDMAPNRLLHNIHNGTFTDVAVRYGVAVGPQGQALSGMGIAIADFHNTLREDLFVTNFSLQPRSYWAADDHGLFASANLGGDLDNSNQPFLAFGAESLDFDLDGHMDIVIGNGHIDPAVDHMGNGVSYRERQQLFRNRGNGTFEDDRRDAGDLDRPRVTRGLAVGDYDNDGRPDILVSGPNEPLTLYHNTCSKGFHWIGFRLQGKRSNRDGVGARVVVRSAGHAGLRVVRSGSSYCSHSDLRPLFGLGTATRADSVEILWPSGTTQRIGPMEADRYYLITEPESPELFRSGANTGSRPHGSMHRAE